MMALPAEKVNLEYPCILITVPHFIAYCQNQLATFQQLARYNSPMLVATNNGHRVPANVRHRLVQRQRTVWLRNGCDVERLCSLRESDDVAILRCDVPVRRIEDGLSVRVNPFACLAQTTLLNL